MNLEFFIKLILTSLSRFIIINCQKSRLMSSNSRTSISFIDFVLSYRSEFHTTIQIFEFIKMQAHVRFVSFYEKFLKKKEKS